jgi:Ran GTPase-activating protein (RanGAP) involved in mRNA processing and transport
MIANSLIQLHIAGNAVSNAAATSVAKFLGTSLKLHELDMSSSSYSAEALEGIFRSLVCNPSLLDFRLLLSNVAISAVDGWERVGALIGRNLCHLDLSRSSLGDVGVACFMEALPQPSPLRSLNLSFTFRGVQSAEYRPRALRSLANFVKSSPSLHTLLFNADSTTRIGAEIAIICDAVGYSLSLRHLEIAGHGAGDAVAESLGKALQRETVLEKLNWDRNGVTASGLRLFRDGLSRNRTCISVKGGIDSAAAVSSDSSLALVLQEIEERLIRNSALGTHKDPVVEGEAVGLLRNDRVPDESLEALSFKFIVSSG